MFIQFKSNDSALAIKAANVWEKDNVGKIHVSHHTSTSHNDEFIITVYYEEVDHNF